MNANHVMVLMRRTSLQRGYSLIELAIFIVIMGIIGTALFSGFNTALLGSSAPELGASPMQLAQERMELILGQKRTLGFAGFTAATFDPCTSAPPSTQAVCTTLPAGYAVSAALATNWGGDTNYKVITVSVTGPGRANLTAMVANY
jgi:type II secretory pathway pseudopilin PulG